MRIDLPLCRHSEMKRICKHYLIDGNCRLNIDAEGAVPPCEDVIEEIMNLWIYEQEGSGEDETSDSAK